jgi:undecaprenyl-diphosphatase
MQYLNAHLLYLITHEYVIILTVLLLSVYLLYKRRIRIAAEFLSAAFLVISIGALLKILWAVPRPLDGLVSIQGYGFPSLHAAWAISLGALVYLLFVRHLHEWKWRLLGDLCLILLIVGIGISRVWLGVHSLPDIIGGYAFGLIIATLIFVIGRKG